MLCRTLCLEMDRGSSEWNKHLPGDVASSLKEASRPTVTSQRGFTRKISVCFSNRLQSRQNMNFSLLPGKFNHSLQAIIVIYTGKYILWGVLQMTT